MRERGPAWAARGFFLLPVFVFLGFVFTRPIYHSNHFWPYGYVHYFGEGLLIVSSYIFAGFAVVTVLTLVTARAGYAVKVLWAIAWYKPYVPWKRRHHRERGLGTGKVYPDRPRQPLLKGRIGSK